MVPFLQLFYLQHTSLSWTGSIPSVQLSLADVPQPWHLQHFKVSTSTLVSPSQLHTMACHGPLASYSLATYHQFQQLSEVMVKESTSFLLFHCPYLQSQYYVDETACMERSLVLFNHISRSFFIQLLSRSRSFLGFGLSLCKVRSFDRLGFAFGVPFLLFQQRAEDVSLISTIIISLSAQTSAIILNLMVPFFQNLLYFFLPHLFFHCGPEETLSISNNHVTDLKI